MTAKGIKAIESLVRTNFSNWSYDNPPEGAIEHYVNMSGIESAYGDANLGSGNGYVFGTWQVATNLVDTMHNHLQNNEGYGYYNEEYIPHAVQDEMAKTYQAVVDRVTEQYKGQELSSDELKKKILQEQDACLVMAVALQADNNKTLINLSNIEAKEIETTFPEHEFALTYIKHQLPPEPVANIYKALEKIKNDPSQKEAILAQPIGDFVLKKYQDSNPSTYKGVTNLGEFLELLDGKQELETTVAAASSGILLPTKDSIDFVTKDVEGYDPELAKKLSKVSEPFKEQTKNLVKQVNIAKTLKEFSEYTTALFKQHSVEMDQDALTLAMHVGPYSALVLSGDHDENALVSELKVQDAQGKTIIANKESVQNFMKEAGYDDVDYESLTLSELREAEKTYIKGQTAEAKTKIKSRRDGEQTKEQKEEFDFFEMITEMMGGLLSILAMPFQLIGSLFGDKEISDTDRVAAEASSAVEGITVLPQDTSSAPLPKNNNTVRVR